MGNALHLAVDAMQLHSVVVTHCTPQNAKYSWRDLGRMTAWSSSLRAHSSVGFGVSHSHNEQRMQAAAAAGVESSTTGTSSCRFALDRCSLRLRGVMEMPVDSQAILRRESTGGNNAVA